MPFYVLPFRPVAPTLPFWLRAAVAFGSRMEQHRPRCPGYLCVQPAPRGWLLEGLLAVGLLLASAGPSPPRGLSCPLCPPKPASFPEDPTGTSAFLQVCALSVGPIRTGPLRVRTLSPARPSAEGLRLWWEE